MPGDAPKTIETAASVDAFIDALADPRKRNDSRILLRLMSEWTGAPARMWGTGIVGFGSYHYTYASGREGDSCLIGFSPRKAEFSIYLSGRHPDAARDALLARLGPHRMGKGCLYVKRLDDIDMGVLAELARASIAALRSTYPSKP